MPQKRGLFNEIRSGATPTSSGNGFDAQTAQHTIKETEFERGVRRFGFLLMEVTLLLVIAIFAFNVFLARPVLDSFLFALALAVGLTPRLLPAIICINLAHGARRMAGQQVIVKRLAAIEIFGSMEVFCADKTGTLPEGAVAFGLLFLLLRRRRRFSAPAGSSSRRPRRPSLCWPFGRGAGSSPAVPPALCFWQRAA